jgi:hypothetical protein
MFSGSLSTSLGVSQFLDTDAASSHLEGPVTARAAQRETAPLSHGLLATISSYPMRLPLRSTATSSSPPSTVRLVSPSTEIGRFPMTIHKRVRFSHRGNLIFSYDLTDVAAAQQALDVAIGWYADPVYLGFYPDHMKKMLGDRLPVFSPEEWALVKGSSDFYGMNTYTTNLASMCTPSRVCNTYFPTCRGRRE